MTDIIEPVPKQIDAQQLAAELVERARAGDVELVGPGGLLTRGVSVSTPAEVHNDPSAE